MLAGILDAYRAHGMPCEANRILDTRMTFDEFVDAAKPRYAWEGSRIDGECAASGRDAGTVIACPDCGRSTTMVRRGDYPRDERAECGMAEWRRAGMAGEPRPTLQWVRPHGECVVSNSHSLMLLTADAPGDGGTLRDFALVWVFEEADRIPHVYGAG